MLAFVDTIDDFMALSLLLKFEHLVILYHTWMVTVCLWSVFIWKKETFAVLVLSWL